jgi:hypothetical protein
MCFAAHTCVASARLTRLGLVSPGFEGAAAPVVQRAPATRGSTVNRLHSAHPGRTGGSVWGSASAAFAGAHAASATRMLLDGALSWRFVRGFCLHVCLCDTRAASFEQDAELAQAARSAAEAIILAVDEDSLDEVVGELLRGLEDPSSGCRAASALLTGFYFKASQADLEEHVPTIIGAPCEPVLAACSPFTPLNVVCAPAGALVLQLVDTDASAVQAGLAALVDVTSVIPKDDLHRYVRCVRDAVASAREKVRLVGWQLLCRLARAADTCTAAVQERRRSRKEPVLVAGFCLQKGLAPVLPIYLQAILTGLHTGACLND